MNKTNYTIINFSASQFEFSNKKLSGYSFFFVGRNPLKITGFDNQNSEDWIQFFKESNIVSIGFAKKQNLPILEKELELIQQKIDFKKSHFTVLLPYENPNIHRSQYNLPSEESFLISPNDFVQFYEKDIPTGLCYHFMTMVLEGKNQIEQIFTHQIGHPNPVLVHQSENRESAEVIMPHKGNLEELETALWYLKKQQTAPQKISVCFDEFVSGDHFKLADKHSKARFFVNFPSGVGPYPSRDILARGTEENVIVFHDSDDISTSNRIAVLTNILKNNIADAVGSHELRVNKIDKKIEAVRFPLDVIDLEDKRNRHSILFPTTAMKKSAYLKAGGLSTIRRHSSDSQFYWRAHFFLNIRNVDEFLYIRVKRANSLTTSSATALGTNVRERLNRQWRMDFDRIQNRNISLLESTLIDEYNVAEIDLVPLKKEYRDTIINWQKLKQSLRENNPFYLSKKPTFPEESDILKNRLLEFRLVKDPGVSELKKSFSWRIGWSITRMIIALFGWIPFVKKHL